MIKFSNRLKAMFLVGLMTIFCLPLSSYANNEPVPDVVISTAAELRAFMTSMNVDEVYYNKLVVLANDIDLNPGFTFHADGSYNGNGIPTEWVHSDDTYGFMGTFDGQNHTIKGLYVNKNSSRANSSVGLFSLNMGTIKNVNIENSYLTSKMQIGTIAALSRGPIQNCSVDAKIEYAPSKSYNSQMGLICGVNYNEISNCIAFGNIHDANYNADDFIVGNTTNVSISTATGGICGVNASVVTDCTNYANIDTVNVTGGIVGMSVGEKIENCANIGTVRGLTDYTGGIVGKSQGSKTLNCYNKGSISGHTYVGGLCGQADDLIEGCFNLTDVNGYDHVGGIAGDSYGSITKCYNMGEIAGDNICGGITGTGYDLITSCYNRGKVTGNDLIAGLIAITRNITSNNSNNCYNASEVIANTNGGILTARIDAGVYSDCVYDTSVCSLPICGSSNSSACTNIYGLTNKLKDALELNYLSTEYKMDDAENDGYPHLSETGVYTVKNQDNELICNHVAGSKTNLPTPAPKSGYEFKGWYIGSSFTPCISKDSTKSYILTSNWSPNRYIVNFDADEGEVTPTSEQYTYGQGLTSLPTPVKTGYVFLGWYEGNNKIENISTIDLGNKSVKAKWKILEQTPPVNPNNNSSEISSDNNDLNTLISNKTNTDASSVNKNEQVINPMTGGRISKADYIVSLVVFVLGLITVIFTVKSKKEK